ncbi:MAG: formylglycine-generating enzyme family protein [Saprospiraceae bacterium]|nr:formylglycine-generating enzyme family protein [Saprospiraceae bacterium]
MFEGENGIGEIAKDGTPTESSHDRSKSGFDLVRVEGGTFKMGSPDNEEDRDNDECLHAETVASFSIGKYEVTQADWREIMGSDPPELYFKGCDLCPVERVSWNDIQDFLQKLNARYPGKNYRLPTEAEWEYAARGGLAGVDTYQVFAGSDTPDEFTWYDKNSGSKTHVVGTKKPNRLGLFDMSGNVWEWCQDTYKPYPCDHETSEDGSRRVIRGGSWGYAWRICRAANRYRDAPPIRFIDLGFRLASSSF